MKLFIGGLAGGVAGQRLDPAHAGRDAGIASTEIRPMSPVRLTCVPPHSSTDQPSVLPDALAHRHHAHLVAVFLAEQRARAGRDGVVDRHQPRGDGRILQHDVVGDVLDLFQFLRRDRLGMREVETQPVGRDQRALLRDVIAEHLAQRLVQQMRGGMVLPDGDAARVIDLQQQRVADFDRALLHLDRHARTDRRLSSACR